MKYIINGKFMADCMQGIVRYARELVCAFDEAIDASFDVVLVVPKNAKEIPTFKSIQVIQYGKNTGIVWEQIDFAYFARKHPKAICVNLCNTVPLLGRPGVTILHDVMYKVNPRDYTTFRNRMSRLWHVLQYSRIASRELRVPTVSEFSKREIERYYPKARGKVDVIPDAWQHVLKYQESSDWRDRYPALVPGEFFFSLATLARNKNGKWVMEVAKRNPDCLFAMAGNIYETEYTEVPSNVMLLGFVSDEDACALIKNCRAFLFPSLYEGFGLPPLEALGLGAEVVSSNAASLPEVLGDSVHYIDPLSYDIDLNDILSMPVAGKEAALRCFSWEESGLKLRIVLSALN